MNNNAVAVVSGGNRGMGMAACKALAEQGFHVVLGSRSTEAGEQSARNLVELGLSVEGVQLDVCNTAHIHSLAELLRERHGRIDVLINNAGILNDGEGESSSVFDANPDSILDSFQVNSLGPVLLSNALLPLMRERNYGRIVNLSSGMGQLDDMGGNHPGYRMSKTALNAATRIFAAELAATNIKVNAVCPGWVRTDMGGENADRSIEQGIDTTLWLATLPDDGPSGGFFRDRQSIAW